MMRNLSVCLKGFEDWQHWNLALIDFCGQIIRKHAGNILNKASACDMGDAIDHFFLDEGQDRLHINTSRLQQNIF